MQASSFPLPVSFLGMPSIGFSEMAQLRLEAISFFLVGLLLSAAAVKWLWNWLCKDLAGWPRLTYPKACAAVTLWGLLFVIVLTMISGASVLMTPGAWKKKGGTYALRDDSDPPVATTSDSPDRLDERRRSLERLSMLLQAFAVQHEGRYPTVEEAKYFPADAWRLPDPSGMEYVYVPGLSTADANAVIVYEPTIFPGKQLVMRADGQIDTVDEADAEPDREPAKTAAK